MASKYLRGNCLGMLPSTCRKPICLRLLEVLSYSCTQAVPHPGPGLAATCAAHACAWLCPAASPHRLPGTGVLLPEGTGSGGRRS